MKGAFLRGAPGLLASALIGLLQAGPAVANGGDPEGIGAAAVGSSIEGQVRLAGSRDPIPDVLVLVVGTGLGAVTDAAGRYRIESVPSGRREIEARQVGKASSRVLLVLSPGMRATLDFVLAEAPVELSSVEVIGGRPDALRRLPGAASVITQEALSTQQPISANEALRRVPGIHVQEEEGAGLRANIGIRGLDPDRSRTVLVLEDGVPVALAPYGEPEMYYAPPIDRMARVEIIKGSGSIQFGPQTIGGVVNYVTADAPIIPTGSIHATTGDGGSRFLKGQYGGTWGPARATALGFRKEAENWNGLWFRISDLTTKFGVRTSAGDVGLKLSAYDEASNSTYVGLTDSLYHAAPRAHPSPGDRLDISRYASTGFHEIRFGQSALRTSFYAYRTTRDWNRRDYTYTPSGNAHLFRSTTGGRNRSFGVVGVEPRVRSTWTAGAVTSQLDWGVRAHYERAHDRHLTGTIDSPVQEVRDDEIRTGRAFSAFAQNRFLLTPSLNITPGLRFEHFAFDRNILRTRVRRSDETNTTRSVEDVDIRSSDSVSELIPGVGAAWSPNALTTVFAGVHRGFAPPRTKDALIYEDPTLSPDEQVPDPVTLDLDAEKSWNYEVGARAAPASFLSCEATLFYLNFSNQIVAPSLSAGSAAQGELANQGSTSHKGIEAFASLDLARAFRRSHSVTVEGSYTYSDARFTGTRLLRDAAGDTVDIERNRLPYAPRHRLSGALIYRTPRDLVVRLDATYVGEQFSDSFETREGSANGRTGRIPSYRTLDASARLPMPGVEGLNVLASVKNLTDETYIASRRPEGIKTGLPRLFSLGLVWGF